MENENRNNQHKDQQHESLIERVETILDKQQKPQDHTEKEKRDAMGAHARERLIHCAKVRSQAAADPRLCPRCNYVECICKDDALFNLAAEIVRGFSRTGWLM